MRDNPRILIASDMTARSDRPFDRAVRLAGERWPVRTTSTNKVVHVIVFSRRFIVCMHCQRGAGSVEEAGTR